MMVPPRQRRSTPPRLAALACCLVLPRPLTAEQIHGHAASADGFAFMGKFNFGISNPEHVVVHPQSQQILGFTGPTHGSCGAQVNSFSLKVMNSALK